MTKSNSRSTTANTLPIGPAALLFMALLQLVAAQTPTEDNGNSDGLSTGIKWLIGLSVPTLLCCCLCGYSWYDNAPRESKTARALDLIFSGFGFCGETRKRYTIAEKTAQRERQDAEKQRLNAAENSLSATYTGFNPKGDPITKYLSKADIDEFCENRTGNATISPRASYAAQMARRGQENNFTDENLPADVLELFKQEDAKARKAPPNAPWKLGYRG